MKGKITIVETKERPNEELLELVRVLYGKKGTQEVMREFVPFHGAPVGCIHEYMEYAKKQGWSGCMFIDAVEKIAFALYHDGQRITVT